MIARYIILLFALIINSLAFAQPEKEFNKEEARDMIALCNSYTFLDLYQSDAKILPKGYKRIYSSGVFGMDNKYQLYQKDSLGVINLRGSTAKKISWMENIYSAMIPANGTIRVSDNVFNYKFATDTAAAVHAGYALGMAFLAKDLLLHINLLNQLGIYDFIITGHSQGGALANMLLAYLNHLPENELSHKNTFRCYAFAAPMVGNREFTLEYNKRFCQTNISFNIVNPADIIPTLPHSYRENNTVSENVKSLLFEEFSLVDRVKDGAFLLFEKNIGNTVRRFSTSVAQQISKDVGTVDMPAYVQDINYYKIGNRIELFKASYPKILKDSSILQNDSLMRIYPRAANGHFINRELYRKEPMVYQHKPYNYYISFLQKFLPEEYDLVKEKYLKENL